MKTFFAIIYNFYYKHEDKTDAHFVSIFYLSLLITFNFMSLLMAIYIYYFPRFNFSFYWIIIFFLVAMGSLYFAFIHRKKHLKILEEYKSKSKWLKFLYKTLLFLYAVASIIIMSYAATLLRALNLS